MATDEIPAWLDLATEEMTPDQIDRFARIWDEVGERYPDEDDIDRRAAALSAAVQYLLGEITIDAAGLDREESRGVALGASAAAQQVALMAVEDGMPEAEAARRARIDRRWLRRIQGKN